MTTARKSVSNNIRTLMNNASPKVTQTRLGEVIGREQPQVSQRLNARHPWTLDELEAIATFFDVEITLLVDPDPNAVFKWLAEHGSIELRDQQKRTTAWSTETVHQPQLPFGPNGPDVVIDLRDHRMGDSRHDDARGLLAVGF